MYKYGKTSQRRLETAHEDLQRLFNEAIKYYDLTIVCAERDKDTQDAYFSRGSSKLKYPQSKHNQYPSQAVDFCVYHKSGISWNEQDMMYVAGFIEALAIGMGIKVRVGAMWDNQWPSENRFMDSGHIELI
jgi:peptidoglycan L-alanyl-D-glutamate endopeptidase CwlK